MRNIIYLLTIILLISLISGCAASDAEQIEDETGLQVVTTIFPLSDIIKQLGGDLVNVHYILPAGASPHTYEPTVEQARLVNDADLFVYVGAGLDNWAVGLAETAGHELLLLDLSEKVPLLESTSYNLDEEEWNHLDEHEIEDNHNHEHGPVDPHIWLDPLLVRDLLSPSISAALIALAPEEEINFKQNLVIFQSKLSDLHHGIEHSLSALPDNKFISFHSAWRYFAARYNLQEIAVIARSPGQEPSAGWLAELVELIKAENVSAIFAEPQFSTNLADRIAEESGIEVLLLDPIGSEDISGKDSYITLMLYNLDTLIQGLTD